MIIDVLGDLGLEVSSQGLVLSFESVDGVGFLLALFLFDLEGVFEGEIVGVELLGLLCQFGHFRLFFVQFAFVLLQFGFVLFEGLLEFVELVEQLELFGLGGLCEGSELLCFLCELLFELSGCCGCFLVFVLVVL